MTAYSDVTLLTGTADTTISLDVVARRIAEQKGLDLGQVQGSGPHGRIIKRDVEGATPQAKAPAAERSGRRGPPPAFPDSGKIEVLVAENPKKKGTLTHARFEFYKTAKTVGEFMALGGRREDVIWDAKKGFVEVRAS